MRMMQAQIVTLFMNSKEVYREIMERREIYDIRAVAVSFITVSLLSTGGISSTSTSCSLFWTTCSMKSKQSGEAMSVQSFVLAAVMRRLPRRCSSPGSPALISSCTGEWD